MATSARGEPAAPEPEREQKLEALVVLKAQDVLCAHMDTPGSSVSSTGLSAGVCTAKLAGEHLHLHLPSPSSPLWHIPTGTCFGTSTPAQMAFPSLELLVSNQICTSDSAFPVQLMFSPTRGIISRLSQTKAKE